MNTIRAFLKRELPAQRFNESFGGALVVGHKLRYRDESGRYRTIGTRGLTATAQTADTVGDYLSLTRMAAGGILFGPVGLLAGAAARKNYNQVYVTIERDGQLIGTLTASAKHQEAAYRFAKALTLSGSDPANRT